VFRTNEYYNSLINWDDPADPIRDIRLFLPGTDENSPRFTPWLLERLEPFGLVRFMDWGWANYPTIRTWEDRPRTSWASSASR